MIIDLHTHIWTSADQLGREVADLMRGRHGRRLGRIQAGPAQHEAAMTCVDAAVVMGFRSDRLKACVPNELIADFVRRDPRRRIGVCGIDPMSADALDQIENGVNLGLMGVAVSPACQGFHPAHSSAMRVYERCTEKSLPLFVTNLDPLTPNAVLEFARPALWDEVAVAFPNLPIVLGQLGHPWVEEALVMVGKHSHVFADISGIVSRPWQLYTALLSATSLGVMDKLLFGSGFPFESPAGAIEAIYSVNAFSHGTSMPSIPRAMLRQIVERDSLSCLGIEAEIAQRTVPANEDSMHPELAELDIARKPVTTSGRRLGDLIG